jgi:hypothetical protein
LGHGVGHGLHRSPGRRPCGSFITFIRSPSLGCRVWPIRPFDWEDWLCRSCLHAAW